MGGPIVPAVGVGAPTAQDFADLKQAFENFQQRMTTNEEGLSAVSLTAPPIAAIHGFAGASGQLGTLPANWRLCDGTALSSANYPSLFSVIGTIYGNGCDAGGNVIAGMDFNLPDLRGYFLRGVDGGTGRDPDANSRQNPLAAGAAGAQVGSIQGDGLRQHTHPVNDPGHSHAVVRDFLGNCGGGYGHGGINGVGDILDIHAQPVIGAVTNISVANFGGNESRPLNVAVYWVIRIK